MVRALGEELAYSEFVISPRGGKGESWSSVETIGGIFYVEICIGESSLQMKFYVTDHHHQSSSNINIHNLVFVVVITLNNRIRGIVALMHTHHATFLVIRRTMHSINITHHLLTYIWAQLNTTFHGT